MPTSSTRPPVHDSPSRRRTRFARLASLPSGRRTKFLVLLGVVGILFLAGPLAGKVGDVEENGPTSQLPRDAESTLVEEQLPAFDSDGVETAAVVYARDSGLTRADRQAITDTREALEKYAVDGVVSPPDYSTDGEAATLVLGIDTTDDAVFDRFEDLRATVDDAAPAGLDAKVTGPAATIYDSVSVFDGIDGRILGASVLVVAILLLLTYRSPVLWLVPLLSIAVAMILSQAAIYLLGEHAGLPVDGQSGGILPILVFGVGTDYALLLIARYREELHLYADRHTAMGRAIRRAGPAILASSATVVLGLSCLMLADINSTRSLGAVCAIGVGFAALAMVTVLPMLLTVLGRWVFWPFVPRHEPTTASAEGVDSTDATRWHGAWARISGVVTRAPRLVWTLSAMALAVLALSTLGLNVGTDDAQKFSTTPDSVIGQQVLAEHFPAGNAAPATVLADTADAAAVRQAIAGVDGVERVTEPRRSADGRLVSYEVFLTNAADTAGAENTVRTLRSALDDVDDTAVVGGPTAKAMDGATAAERDAWVVIPVVLIVVVLVLMALLRAVVGPLVLLGTVLLSYAAALGAGGLLMHAMGFDAVDVSLPLLAFVFLVALGVDYTIFLMSRVREEAGRVGHRDGVARGLIATGGVITSAGLVLAATFSVLAVMPIVFMIGLGVVVALGVLLDTFVVRSMLVPALAIDIGLRFWSPSRLATDAAPADPSRTGHLVLTDGRLP